MRVQRYVVGFAVAVWLAVWPMGIAQAATVPGEVNLDTQNEGGTRHVAPGNALIFSVKLLNFGKNSRADVIISYQIKNAAAKVVYEQTETVAVETTAAFVKRLVVPASLGEGVYVLKTHLAYRGQTSAAESEFGFEVVKTIFGLSKGTFYTLAGLTTAMVLVMLVTLVWLRRRWERDSLVRTFAYTGVPEDERVYYQIISESIGQMRRLAGHAAVDVARTIPGLQVNAKTGEVEAVTGNPNAILNTLVLRYETLLGRTIQESLPVTPPSRIRRAA